MTHIIDIPSDYAPYNAIAKGQWVRVDGERKEWLPAATEADVPAAIARRLAELEEEDRRREAEEAARPKRYSKHSLYLAIAKRGMGKTWEQVKEWMKGQTLPDGVNVFEAYDTANDLASDDPYFAPFFQNAKELFGVTDEQAAAILAEAEIAEG